MSFLQQPLERKLSALIGAEVSFATFKMSLLGGWIEAFGVRVAGSTSSPQGGSTPDQPLFTAQRLRAEISVRHALAKQLVVKSLLIEQPIIHIVLDAAGGNNLPHRPAKISPPPGDKEATSKWSLAAQQVTIVDGQIHLHDATCGSTYYTSIEPLTAELHQQGDQTEIALQPAAIARHDQPLPADNLKLASCRVCFSRPVILPAQPEITGLLKQTLRWLLDGHLQAVLELSGGIKLEIHAPSLAYPSAAFNLDVPLDLAALAALLPPSLKLPHPFTPGRMTGQGNVSIAGAFDMDALRLHHCTLNLSPAMAAW